MSLNAPSSLPNVRPSVERLPPVLYRFDAKLSVQPLGVVPEGLRMANAFEGEVTSGMMRGARVSGIDHLLLRTDGVAIIDAQKLISLGDIHVYEKVDGYGLPPNGLQLPPLDDLLAPGFEWPDLLFPVTGSSRFRASHPDYRYLNQVVARIDGWFSFTSGALAVETRIIHHFSAVPAPRTSPRLSSATPQQG